MESFRTYILSVTAAAVLCTLAIGLSGQKGTTAAIIRLICGIIMASVIIRPLGQLVLPDLAESYRDLESQVAAAVASGTERSRQELEEGIVQKICSYIQDKAAALGVDIHVYVELDDRAIPVPVRIELEGNISPSAKTTLAQIIESEIGIRKEDQFWK